MGEQYIFNSRDMGEYLIRDILSASGPCSPGKLPSYLNNKIIPKEAKLFSEPLTPNHQHTPETKHERLFD